MREGQPQPVQGVRASRGRRATSPPTAKYPEPMLFYSTARQETKTGETNGPSSIARFWSHHALRVRVHHAHNAMLVDYRPRTAEFSHFARRGRPMRRLKY